MAGARHVGDLFRSLSEAGGRPLRQDREHHLMFLAQCWSLAIHGRGLFPEPIHAMPMGPRVKNPEADPQPALPDPDEAVLIHRIYERYGQPSAAGLLRIVTAHGTPWSNAYFGRGEGEMIRDEDMRSWATRLALAGREADRPEPEPGALRVP